MTTTLSDEAARRLSDALLSGRWQRDVARRLLRGDTVNPKRELGGRAKQWKNVSSYARSFDRVVLALTTAGYSIERIPGPHGGTSFRSATFRLAQAVPPIGAVSTVNDEGEVKWL